MTQSPDRRVDGTPIPSVGGESLPGRMIRSRLRHGQHVVEFGIRPS